MADQFLSQEEVDALLDGVNGDTPEAAAEEQTGVRPYDLGKQERIVRGRMPTLEIVNERFARNFRVGVFNFMRVQGRVLVLGTTTQQVTLLGEAGGPPPAVPFPQVRA